VAHELATLLAPSAVLLAVAVAVDLAIGDPTYAWHPVRLIGRLLTDIEQGLRALGADGYAGGVVLFVLLGGMSMSVMALIVLVAAGFSVWIAYVVHAFVLYSLLALGDLVQHVWRIERAVKAGDLARARLAVRALVGRDTDRMDEAACRRAAVESLSENLTDGFISPVCWYVVGGLPGLVLFKVVSTMDSMVGFKTPAYLRFGWCGARLDDVMNYVPARLTWIVISIVAAALPGFSGRKAWTTGLGQHAALPSPNSGWSEAATAGALERRLVGPIWLNGTLVTDRWIGDPADPPLATAQDVTRAIVITVISGLVGAGMGSLAIAWTRAVGQ
jgi:adenosylcobinamide-phosphate synthase